MPFTISGIGTKLYGRRGIGPDGSYITTEWVVFLYIPVLPIRSYRVLAMDTGFGRLVAQRYQAQQVALCWAQVRDVYLMYIGIPVAVVATLFAVLYYLA